MDRPNAKTLDWRLTELFFCFLNHDCTCMSVGLYFFSMLVNVYGSKDLFVSEYRTLLADRILSSFNYDTEKEVIAYTLLFVYQFIKLFSMWGITTTDFCKFKFSQFSQKICAFWAPSFSNCLFFFKSLAMEIFGFWTYLKLTCSFSNSLESNIIVLTKFNLTLYMWRIWFILSSRTGILCVYLFAFSICHYFFYFFSSASLSWAFKASFWRIPFALLWDNAEGCGWLQANQFSHTGVSSKEWKYQGKVYGMKLH